MLRVWICKCLPRLAKGQCPAILAEGANSIAEKYSKHSPTDLIPAGRIIPT